MVLVRVPISKHGCDKAPDKIISQIKELELNEDGVLPVVDAEEINSDLEENAGRIFKDNSRAVFIGGDHSVSYEILKAFSKVYSDAGVIIFDAHPDCRKDYYPFGDLVSGLVWDNIIKKENIILVGVRAWHRDELNFLKGNNIRHFSMKKIVEYGKKNLIATIMEQARKFNALYVSVDMDVIDPSAAPGVNDACAGGLSSREILFFLQKLKLLNNLKGVDIVEVKPDKDINDITVKLAGKIVMELA